MNLIEFLDKHNACQSGRDWAIETECETIEDLWLRTDIIADWRMWIARRVLPTKTLQIFACKAVRSIWHLLKDERSRNAIVVAELFLSGEATIEQLREARTAADAASTAAYAADAARKEKWNELIAILMELAPTITVE